MSPPSLIIMRFRRRTMYLTGIVGIFSVYLAWDHLLRRLQRKPVQGGRQDVALLDLHVQPGLQHLLQRPDL